MVLFQMMGSGDRFDLLGVGECGLMSFRAFGGSTVKISSHQLDHLLHHGDQEGKVGMSLFVI